MAYFFAYYQLIKQNIMSHIIYLLSILTAIVWSFCYMLFDISAGFHIFLLLAFLGIAASFYIDSHKTSPNQ